jgi:hypothetical protein
VPARGLPRRCWRGCLACGRRTRVRRRLRGGGLLPLDGGFGPKLVRPLPRRRTRASGARALGANGLGARVLGARPPGTGGLEAWAARTAIPRPGRAEDSERPRRQRGGPGSVRLAGGRGHRARVRPGATGRPRAGSELKAGGRGRGWSAGPWFGGSFVRGRHVEDGGVGDSVVGDSVVEGCVVEGGRGEPLAGQVTLGVPGGRALWLGGDALWLGRDALWLGGRRAGGAQEPYRWGCDAGPGIVVSGWRYDSRRRAGHGLRGISFRQARARNYQARRHGPGGHEIFRIIPAVQAGTLPLFLSQGV